MNDPTTPPEPTATPDPTARPDPRTPPDPTATPDPTTPPGPLDRTHRLWSRLAHDLKGPLGVVAGLVALAAEAPQLDPEHQHLLHRAARQTRLLRRRVERLHAWMGLETLAPPGPFTLATLAQVARRRLVDPRHPAPLSSVPALHLAAPETTLWGDAEGLGWLLAELWDNAARYGAAPLVLALTPEGAGLALSLTDAGPGIAASDRDRALRPLERLVGDAEHPGDGLGLAVAARIADLHGACLRLDTPAGGGLRVTVAGLRRPEASSEGQAGGPSRVPT